MKNVRLLELKNAYRLEGIDSVLVDQINTYPITIREYNDTNLITIAFPLPQEVYQMYYATIETKLKELADLRISYKGGIVSIVLSKKDDAVKLYHEITGILSNTLHSEYNLLPCVYCHKHQADTFVLSNQLYVAAHKQCHQQYVQELNKPKNSLLSLITGSIGALLGALLPMLVAFLIIILTDRSFGYIYLFCGFASVGGYRLLKGGLGKRAIAITLTADVLAFIIFMYVTCYYSFQQLEYASFFSTSEILGLELAFFILGIIGVLASTPFSKKEIMKEQEAADVLSKPIIRS